MITDIQIYPIDSEELRQKVYEEAYKDGNRHPLMPTHVVMRHGEIVGAFSTWTPTSYWWMHTQRMKVRDCKLVFQGMDTLMRQQGTPKYIMPCEPESPFYSLLKNRCDIHPGTDGGDWTLFMNKD